MCMKGDGLTLSDLVTKKQKLKTVLDKLVYWSDVDKIDSLAVAVDCLPPKLPSRWAKETG